MTLPSEPPTSDPDNVPETLCLGRLNLATGPGPLATLTFTNIRPKAGPLIDSNSVQNENIVRARIVTTLENLVALRDLLNTAIHQNTPIAASASDTLN